MGDVEREHADLVRQIESVSPEGTDTIVVIRKRPGDVVIPERPGYVQGLLDGELRIRSVTETQVVGVIADTPVEKIQGSWTAVLNASRVPKAGAPVALVGQKTLEHDTEARVVSYSVVDAKQLMLSIGLGAEAGVQPGMVGQLELRLGGSSSLGNFTVERVGPTFALALMEVAEAAGSVDHVKQIIMGCSAVVSAPLQAAPPRARAKAARGRRR